MSCPWLPLTLIVAVGRMDALRILPFRPAIVLTCRQTAIQQTCGGTLAGRDSWLRCFSPQREWNTSIGSNAQFAPDDDPSTRDIQAGGAAKPLAINACFESCNQGFAR